LKTEFLLIDVNRPAHTKVVVQLMSIEGMSIPRLTLCNIPRAVRRDSEQHIVEKSVPQEENNHDVDNRDFDRAMKTVTRSSPQPHAFPLVTEDPSEKERRSIDHDAIPPVASIHSGECIKDSRGIDRLPV
jgi:hypothetical protein